MGIFDVILLIIIALVAFRGFMKGLVMELFGFIALFVAFFIAYEYSAMFAKVFNIFGFSPRTNGALGYVLAFVLSYIVVFFIGMFISKMFKEVKLGWANQGGGAAFGALKAAAMIGVALSMLITTLPSDSSFSKNLKEGAVSGKLAKLAPLVFDMMNKIPQAKKDNPFDMSALDKMKETLDSVDEESVQEAVDTVKDVADKAGKLNKAVEDAPLKDLQDEFQKN